MTRSRSVIVTITPVVNDQTACEKLIGQWTVIIGRLKQLKLKAKPQPVVIIVLASGYWWLQ